MTVEQATRKATEPATPSPRDPVWVYESQLGTDISRGAAAVARKCRGAVAGCYAGFNGANYAIPTRDAEGKLLNWNAIENHVAVFLEDAAAQPDTQFKILPDSLRKTDDEHARLCELLRNAPANCSLTGRMLERLGRLRDVRIILIDANITIVESEREEILDQFFAANEGLWNADHIEIVSLGSPHSLVANDKYTRKRHYRHRIIGANREIYGNYAGQVSELLSVAYSTKALCLNDPTGTSTGNQIGVLNLALCGDIDIDERLIQ